MRACSVGGWQLKAIAAAQADTLNQKKANEALEAQVWDVLMSYRIDWLELVDEQASGRSSRAGKPSRAADASPANPGRAARQRGTALFAPPPSACPSLSQPISHSASLSLSASLSAYFDLFAPSSTHIKHSLPPLPPSSEDAEPCERR